MLRGTRGYKSYFQYISIPQSVVDINIFIIKTVWVILNKNKYLTN